MNTTAINLSFENTEFDQGNIHPETNAHLHETDQSIESEALENTSEKDPLSQPSNSPEGSAKRAIFSVNKVLILIKFIGAATVAAAMGVFLFEGLEVAGDIQRYFSIAGFGVLMTVLGLAVFYGLKDRVASRLFLGLSLGSVPLVSSVLGGLTFSLTEAAKQITIPSFAIWTVPDSASLYFALPIGLVAITAIAALGFMVLARSEWRWMTATLLITNALLVIPSRSALVVTFLALTSLSCIIWLIKKKTKNQAVVKTFEGTWALGILFVAPIILVARTAFLYEHNPLMILSAATFLFIATRHWLNTCEAGTIASVIASIITFICAIFAVFHGCLFLSVAMPDLFSRGGILNDGEGVIAASLLLAVQLDVSRKNPKHFISKAQNVLTCLSASFWFLMPFLGVGGVLTCVLALTMPIAFSVLHWRQGNRASAGILALCAAICLVLNGDNFLNFIAESGWLGLAAAGSLIIIGGAALERTHSKLKINSGSTAVVLGN